LSTRATKPLVLSREAMGTTFELVLVGEPKHHGRLANIGEAVFDGIDEVEASWSLFLPTSRLALLNRTGHKRGLALDTDDLQLFRVIEEVHRASLGAFDPNVARQMEAALHFEARGLQACLGAGGDVESESRDIGTKSDGATWELDESTSQVRFTGLGPALDLGAVAKGHALDLAARELREFGVEAALLHGGTSSVIAIGTPPDQEAWIVRVDDRDLALKDQALAVSHAGSQSASGDSHIFIPGDSQNSVSVDRSSAVVAQSAAAADAWATALCVNPNLEKYAASYLQERRIEILPGPKSVPAVVSTST
jgi:thiamine biosynthesis lipoprotein